MAQDAHGDTGKKSMLGEVFFLFLCYTVAVEHRHASARTGGEVHDSRTRMNSVMTQQRKKR
jgi:hypothetical protein